MSSWSESATKEPSDGELGKGFPSDDELGKDWCAVSGSLALLIALVGVVPGGSSIAGNDGGTKSDICGDEVVEKVSWWCRVLV